MRLNQPSTCAAFFFANSGNGSGQCTPVRPIPSPQPPLVPDLKNSDICRLPSRFPTCSSEAVTVDAGTVRTLDPGTYGNLTVNGGTLDARFNGEYVFCNVDVNNGSIVVVVAPSTLLVTDRFNVQPDALINAEGTPTDLRVLVNGLGVNLSGVVEHEFRLPRRARHRREHRPAGVRQRGFAPFQSRGFSRGPPSSLRSAHPR